MKVSFHICALFLLPMAVFAAEPPAVFLTASDVPPSCKIIPGTFPVGPKTQKLYEYEAYAVVMPPLVKKAAQSFQCGSEKGSFFYFQYSSDEDRDRAELFAKPILAKEEGVAQGPSVVERSKAFLVISFKQAPPALMDALNKKLNISTVPLPSVQSSSPNTPFPVKVQKSEPVPILTAPMPAEKLSPVSLPPHHSLVPVVASSPNPVLVAKTLSVQESIPKPVPVVSLTPSPVLYKPMVFTGEVEADISDKTLVAYHEKLGCSSGFLRGDFKNICELLEAFKAGMKPDWSSSNTLVLGPAYTIDDYGRIQGFHYDVLAQGDVPGKIGFFALTIDNGIAGIEFQSLMEARKSHKDLPHNGVWNHIQTLIPRKQVLVRESTDLSLVALVGGARSAFIRKSGDHLVLIAPQGKTVEEQIHSSIVVATLY